jgi:hypothetical protein
MKTGRLRKVPEYKGLTHIFIAVSYFLVTFTAFRFQARDSGKIEAGTQAAHAPAPGMIATAVERGRAVALGSSGPEPEAVGAIPGTAGVGPELSTA